MSNNIQVFDFKENVIRAIQDDNGNPLFYAKDICMALEINNVSHACSRLDDDEKGIIENDTLGGKQSVLMVNESGLYSLIFTSYKPEAKVFRKWVTGEVLPSIRKTGRYENVPSDLSNHEARLSRLEQKFIDVPRQPIARAHIDSPSADAADIVLATIQKHCAGVAKDIKESILILCCKAYRAMDTDSRENIINALVLSGCVEVKSNEGKGRPGRKFAAKNKV